MAETGFTPTALLGGYLRQLGPDGAVKLARELCAQLEGDPDSFHGGVWPGNVDLDVEGKAVLGKPDHTPAAQRPADAVEYTAPEFFWHGAASAAADVFAVGLMLYAGCSGGLLPFQPAEGELTDRDRADALRRRMKGQPVTAPDGVSPELKKVIEKALAYDPEERYITAAEMLSALGRTDEALPSAKNAAAVAAAAAAVEDTPAPAAESPMPEEEPSAPAEEAAAPEEEPSAPVEEASIPKEEPSAPVEEAATPEEETPSHKAEAAAPEEETPAPAAEAAVPKAKPAAAKRPAAKRPAPAAGQRSAHAGSAAPAGQTGSSQHPAGSRQAHLQKGRPAQTRKAASAVPAAQRKRRSKTAPVLAALLAAAVLGGGWSIYHFLRPGRPELSQPFSPPAAQTESPEQPTQTPLATATAEPTPTARPTATPRPSASPRPAVSPQPTDAGGTGAGTAGTGTGTAAGTATGTGTGSAYGGYGTGVGSGGSGTGTGTGSGYGTGTGTGSGYGSGYGTGSGSGGYGTGTGSGSASGGSNPGYTVQAAGGTVYLTGDYVRVRSGPGTGYAILALTRRGESCARTGTVSNGWTRVNYKGLTGYIYSQYLTDQAPATPTPAPSVPPEATATPAPSATPAPAKAYAVVREAKTYAEALQAAGQAGLAAVTSQEDLQALTQALADSGLEYVWIGAEKSAEDGSWSSGGVKLDDGWWAANEPDPANDLLLLHKTEAGWQFITAKSDGFAPETYGDTLGYVTNKTA